jgi:uncharacterized membrane protein
VSEWVVLLHVAVAFWFVGGLIGRNVTFAKARASTDIVVVGELTELAGRFERFMVIPGSAAVLVAGLLAVWAEGRPLAGPGNGWLLLSLLLYLTLIPLVPLVFLSRGRVFERALADATQRGEVTPELGTAFHDQAVAAARIYEVIVIALIVVLMVVKPF